MAILNGASASVPSSSPVCVYLAGSGRNGSTVLGMLLARRSDVFFAGELTHIWRRSYLNDELCGCGHPFSQCDFWREVTRAAFGTLTQTDVRHIESLRNEVSRFSRIPWLLMGRQGNSERGAAYATVYGTLLEAIACVSGSRYVVDSSKYPTDLEALARNIEVPLYLVHLIRDCNAVVFAWKKKRARPEIHWARQLMPRYRTATVALGWRFFNSAIANIAADKGNRYRKVRYEDLVTGFPGSVADLAGWLGVESNFATDAAVAGNHTVSGNPCRFTFDHNNVRLDEEWRDGLSHTSRHLVRLLCGRTQRALGYE